MTFHKRHLKGLLLLFSLFVWFIGVPSIAAADAKASFSQQGFGNTTLATTHSTLRRGDRGPAVLELQHKLNAAGAHPPLPTDGEFGPKTQKAVKDFQQENGLASDGIVGLKTWRALDSASSGPNKLLSHQVTTLPVNLEYYRSADVEQFLFKAKSDPPEQLLTVPKPLLEHSRSADLEHLTPTSKHSFNNWPTPSHGIVPIYDHVQQPDLTSTSPMPGMSMSLGAGSSPSCLGPHGPPPCEVGLWTDTYRSSDLSFNSPSSKISNTIVQETSRFLSRMRKLVVIFGP
jgi:hypothetical protein